MKRTLYFVIDKELRDIDGIEETTGNKTITVYEVKNNKLQKHVDIEAANEDSSIEMINEMLVEDGEDPRDFELIQL
jgi:hypothetical protein